MFAEKAEIMDADAVNRAVGRIACEIMERSAGGGNLVFIGIETEGVLLARAAARRIKETDNIDIPVGSLDITFYRDDLTMLSEHPVVRGTDIAFPVQDKNIVLFDDVLYTGRTIRAAIGELFDMGRPAKIELAVLIDRGHRELPIQADYVGRNVPTAKKEYIYVGTQDGNITRTAIGVVKKGE